MIKKTRFRLIIVCFSAIFLTCGLYAQVNKLSLTDNDIKLIKEYDDEIVKCKIANNYNQASHYITKVAYLYWNVNHFDNSIKYFTDAIECYEKTGNKNAKKVIFNNLGMIYSDIEDYPQSLKYFEKGLAISKEIDDDKEIALGFNNIAIANSYLEKYDVALEYAKKALDIGAELNDKHLMLSCYIMLTEYYEKLGNTEKSLEYFNFYSSLQKHIQEEENKIRMKELHDRTKRAEMEKLLKEKELLTTTASLEEAQKVNRERMLQIDNLNKDKEISELKLKEKETEIRRRNNLIKGAIAVFIIIFIFSLVVFRLYRQKLKNNKLLEEQNIKLTSQKEKINEQRKQLEHSNKKLEKKNVQILDSISYASRIQEAILPYESRIKKLLPESFIFFKPRDIVSGDFYWFSEQHGKIFIAEVDCTGHGVPGAFMSMIGNTLLNEIVNDKGVYKPSEILKQLNKGIIFTLNQENSSDNFQDDGMEVSLCCIDKAAKTVEIALANQTAYLVENNEIRLIEGDIYSVGGTFSLSDDDEFTNHSIKYTEDTSLYMLSDGYADQFGGIQNHKFLASQLQDLLLDNNSLSMKDQSDILEMTFNSWKGNKKQIDDILVIGIKFQDA